MTLRNPKDLQINAIEDFAALTLGQKEFAQHLLDTYGLPTAERYAQVVVCKEEEKEVAHTKKPKPSIARAVECNRVLNGLNGWEAFNLLLQARRFDWVQGDGERYLSTQQVALYYRVPIETIKSVLNRERQNLKLDGLTTLHGYALAQLRHEFGVSSATPSLIVWPPRAVLRVGLMLRDSGVAAKLQNIQSPALSSSGQSVKLQKQIPLRVLMGARP